MAESESAVARGSDPEDDCPLCLEPLPPFWDLNRLSSLICCGQYICKGCSDSRDAVLRRAVAEGTFGRQERQLGGFCPLCRTKVPDCGSTAKLLLDQFQEGRLPLHLYRKLGLSYLKGAEGVEVDVDRGIEILMLGAERGDLNCQCLIGDRYIQGSDGLPKSVEDAKRWWLAAAERGHAIAEYNLAVTFRDEGRDSEYLQSLKGSVSKGYDNACFNLGLAYYNGDNGLLHSTEEAIHVLTPAAERGDADCMSLLGSCMVYPDPDSESSEEPWHNPNFTKGMHWIRRAAEMGDEHPVKQLQITEEDASGNCFMCSKEAPPKKAFLRCSRCRAAWYCSKDCQRRHWKTEEGGHKQVCIKWVSSTAGKSKH